MKHPWQEIDLNDYENHMSLNSVGQLRVLNEMTKDQFYAYPVQSVIILGIAGGNGLEHIDKQVIHKVYGVDINHSYLQACKSRYPELQGVLETIHADLTQSIECLPHADLLIANLFIEYIGYDCFRRVVEQVKPKYISCVIQIDTDASFVSDSPYIRVFDRLAEIHQQIEETSLIRAMEQVGFKNIAETTKDLPNGKCLVRMDFKTKG